MPREKHIDDVQTSTVDEHFQLILDDRTTIDSEFRKVTSDDLPEWYDERLFKIGQKYYMDNMLAFGTANVAGLISILSVPEILEVLIHTKQSSTICLSYKRYTITLLLIFALFSTNISDPCSKWFKALNVIRWKHATASKKCIKEGLHGIYQKDMAITQFGFIGFIFVCPEKLGLMHGTAEQRSGFHHFWRVTARLLGITDRMNICRKTVEETTELCTRIAYEILAKHLDDSLPEFVNLSLNTITSFWYIDPSIDASAFLSFTYEITGAKYKEPLRWYSYLNLKRLEWVLYLCDVSYIGWVVRTTYNIILSLYYGLLEYYPIGGWLGFGKEHSKICLYPNI